MNSGADNKAEGTTIAVNTRRYNEASGFHSIVSSTREIILGVSTNHTFRYQMQMSMKPKSASDDEVPNILWCQSFNSSESRCGIDEVSSFEHLLIGMKLENGIENIRLAI